MGTIGELYGQCRDRRTTGNPQHTPSQVERMWEDPMDEHANLKRKSQRNQSLGLIGFISQEEPPTCSSGIEEV